jgi:hypothetical protein
VERRRARTTSTMTSSVIAYADFQKFLVRGVVYQSHEQGPFTLEGRDLMESDRLAQLRHDVGLFKELGVNTVYVCKYTNGFRYFWYVLTDETRSTT